MGPVVVVIDEADAALGNREAGGDSGTSSRVFSMIAAQMGDTRYRGKLLWMLLTSRPDLLPIDLKRQGRAEVHLPLFSPADDAEIAVMIKVLARKNKTSLADSHAQGPVGPWVERRRHRKHRALGKANRADPVSRGDHAATIWTVPSQDFIPSAQGLEKEKQELAAVLECTSMSFLPEAWRARVTSPDGRAKLQERMAAIRRLIEE